MQKNSIKREQSQAGLSFAERKNFRPQVKNKLLLLLVLLMTAATGAWADETLLLTINSTDYASFKSGSKTFDDKVTVTFSNSVGNDADNEGWYTTSSGSLLTVAGINGYTITSCKFYVDFNGSAKTGYTVEGESPSVYLHNGEVFTDDSELVSIGTVGITKIEVYTAAASGSGSGEEAQTAKHLITATYDKQTRLLEQPLPYATTIGELYEAVSGHSFSDLISTMSLVEMPLTGISSNNTSVVSIGELNCASTPVTVNADGKATISLNFGSFAQGIFVSAISPLYANMKDGVKDADKWTAKVGEGEAKALPIGGLKGDGSETVTLQYNGRLKVKGVKATSGAAPAAGNIVDLSTLTADYEAQNGDVLTGVTTSYKVTIAAGATVTLDGVTISSGDYCIKCLGDATIILKDGSTNTLTGTGGNYPALWIGDANTTLTIQGSTGELNVTSGAYCAGIGGGYNNNDHTCGNIRIEGGVITAQGGHNGAGIGTDNGPATCGDIIITGGTITAKGGNYAAGIGTGYGSGNPAVCGAITIANTVTKVTATKGDEYVPYSIGKGYGGKASCGTVTIGGTVYWENNAAVGDGATYLAQSPLIYDPTAPAYTLLSAATTSDYGKVVCAAGHLHDAKTAVPDGCTAVGIVGKVTTTGHGLILALKDATSQNWNTINGWASVTTYASTTLKVLPNDAARGTNLTSYTTLGSTGVSNWAVAQKSDYVAIFQNLGSTKSHDDGTTYDGNVNAYITTGVGGRALSVNYWSATLDGDMQCPWGIFSNNGGYWNIDDNASAIFKIRPVLGF